MPRRPIIEHLDVFEEVLLGFGSCGLVPMISELALPCPEETLNAGVVPAIACVTHAGRDAMRGEQLPARPRGILTPTIGVMPESSVGPPSGARRAEGLFC